MGIKVTGDEPMIDITQQAPTTPKQTETQPKEPKKEKPKLTFDLKTIKKMLDISFPNIILPITMSVALAKFSAILDKRQYSLFASLTKIILLLFSITAFFTNSTILLACITSLLINFALDIAFTMRFKIQTIQTQEQDLSHSIKGKTLNFSHIDIPKSLKVYLKEENLTNGKD